MRDLSFNESDYLAANPDVMDAVKEGQFQSGYEHFEMYGKSEGRALKRSSSREDKVFISWIGVD